MGGIGTVYPDGAINAVKNPALIAVQKEKSSLGFLFDYRPYVQSDSIFYFSNLSNEKTDSEIEKDISGGASIAFTKRFNKQGFGICFSNSDDYLYSHKEESREISGWATDTQVFSIDSKNKEKKIIPQLSFSYGLQLGDNSSFGIRLVGGYSRIDKESETSVAVLDGGSTLLSNNKNYDETKNIISGQLSFGYFFSEKGNQLGFMVNSGRLRFIKSDIDYFNDDLAEPDGDNSFSYYKQYDKGASFVAGGYTRLLPFLGVALEGGFELPVYFDEKEFDDDTFEAIEKSVSNDSTILVKGGLDFILSPQLRFDVGSIAFSSIYNKSRDKNNYETTSLRGFSFMAGIDYQSQGGVRLMAGTMLNRYIISQQQKEESGSIIDIKVEVLAIKTVIGVMYNF
jgi:hypothetical protein